MAKAEPKTAAQAETAIEAHIAAAKATLALAEALADKFGLSFYFAVEYGMGGTYTGKRSEDSEWESSDEWTESTEGWQSSSSSC